MKKVVCIVVWVLLTMLYVFLMNDEGRAIGAQSESHIIDLAEYAINAFTPDTEYLQNDDADLQETTDAINKSLNDIDDSFDQLQLNQHRLKKIYQNGFTYISVFNVVYLVLTLLLYHIGFIRNAKDS